MLSLMGKERSLAALQTSSAVCSLPSSMNFSTRVPTNLKTPPVLKMVVASTATSMDTVVQAYRGTARAVTPTATPFHNTWHASSTDLVNRGRDSSCSLMDSPLPVIQRAKRNPSGTQASIRLAAVRECPVVAGTSSSQPRQTADLGGVERRCFESQLLGSALDSRCRPEVAHCEGPLRDGEPHTRAQRG
jgi:hypothetical protein